MDAAQVVDQPDKDRSQVPQDWTSRFFQPVPIDWLVIFRISFGLVMAWYGYKALSSGAVDLFYVIPVYHFPYDGFRWIKPIEMTIQVGSATYEFIHFEYGLLIVCSLLIAVGLMYRLAALVFAVSFAHIFLIDKCYYQNHYYLVCLFGLVLPFLPAHRAFSVDARLFPQIRSAVVSIWTLYLVRFLVGVPYFFGGIAKVAPDWIAGQPMRAAMLGKMDTPLIGGPWMEQEWFVQFIVWGGLLFDLTVVPALLWKRTRPFAYLAALSFHLMNAFTWTIGIFPWMMILITTVYFDPAWPRQLLAKIRRRPLNTDQIASWNPHSALAQKMIVGTLTLFVVWQCVMPFRYLAFPGNSNWDEYTHHFSWHMLLRAKKCGLRVYATDPVSGRSGTIDLRAHLTSRQLAVVARDPRMIHDLCLNIAENFKARGMPTVELRALSLVSMNGRKPQMMVDPTVDLSARPYPLSYPDYVVPLTEPFRHDGWDEPLAEWEQHLELDLPPQMQLTPPPQSAPSNTTPPS